MVIGKREPATPQQAGGRRGERWSCRPGSPAAASPQGPRAERPLRATRNRTPGAELGMSREPSGNGQADGHTDGQTDRQTEPPSRHAQTDADTGKGGGRKRD